MIYQIVHPVIMSIDSESIKDAIKNYVKMNDRMNINHLIITDHINHYKAKMKYFKHDSKQKVGISIYPTTWPLVIKNDGEIISPLNTWPYTSSVEYNTKEYPATTFIETPLFIPRIIPYIPII